ncbi:DUF2812 domain-containing protein [Bacillus sp. SB49]|uniref:DUF2812 domain-containing protein n=1 Tax=Bacillus sp. SB49 TaxID=1071080 RepID=UPI0003FAE8AF|nr:DUF2812 domain-containing protein [Bacillus sp. SB49]QHT46182.1 DUF2812 domain-containing protein [Bacillus sp. SB49]
MKRKYIMMDGLAFSEGKEMEKLARYAKKGWHVERFLLLGFRLRKGEPEEKQFEIDYRESPDEDYFDLFEEAGWRHVCSSVDYIHLFTAEPETTPLYTDKTSLLEKYETEKEKDGKWALWSLVTTVLAFLLSALSSEAGLPTWIGEAFKWIGIIALFPTMITGMVFLGFAYRCRKLRKGRTGAKTNV